MNSKERVKLNVYKQLLKEEKTRNKNIKRAASTFIILAFVTFTTYNEYKNSQENYNLFSYIYEEGASIKNTVSEEGVSSLVTEDIETSSTNTIRGDLYDDFFSNL